MLLDSQTMRVDRLDLHDISDVKVHSGREVSRNRDDDVSTGLPKSPR